jgi:hypothetical protein
MSSSSVDGFLAPAAVSCALGGGEATAKKPGFASGPPVRTWMYWPGLV